MEIFLIQKEKKQGSVPLLGGKKLRKSRGGGGGGYSEEGEGKSKVLWGKCIKKGSSRRRSDLCCNSVGGTQMYRGLKKGGSQKNWSRGKE